MFPFEKLTISFNSHNQSSFSSSLNDCQAWKNNWVHVRFTREQRAKRNCGQQKIRHSPWTTSTNGVSPPVDILIVMPQPNQNQFEQKFVPFERISKLVLKGQPLMTVAATNCMSRCQEYAACTCSNQKRRLWSANKIDILHEQPVQMVSVRPSIN